MTESLAFFTCGVGALRDHARARAPDDRPPARPARRGSGRVLTRPQFGALYVDLAPRARARLVDPARRATPGTRGSPRALAERRAARARRRSSSRAASCLGQLAERVVRRLLGALARLRPAPGGEVVRLPPRRLRDLPRRHTVAVAPIVLWSLLREGAGGSERSAAFAALFLSANAVGLLVVAAFNSTPYAYDRLHDRYAFYFIPLWLIVFVAWLAHGLPRPLVATATGVVLALALPAILPVRPARERGRHRHRAGRALGLARDPRRPGPDRVSGRACSPCSSSGSSPRRFSFRAGLRLASPARRARRVRGHGGLRLGADDRRAGERRSSRAGSSPRGSTSSFPTMRASRSSISSRRLPRFEPHPPRAVRNRVLQRDRRPRRLHRRLDSRTESRSTASRSRRTRSSSRTAPRSSRTSSTPSRASSSPASGSAPERPRGSCSGGRTARSASSARETTDDVRTADCA